MTNELSRIVENWSHLSPAATTVLLAAIEAAASKQRIPLPSRWARHAHGSARLSSGDYHSLILDFAPVESASKPAE
jgi:hypothetical protein